MEQTKDGNQKQGDRSVKDIHLLLAVDLEAPNMNRAGIPDCLGQLYFRYQPTISFLDECSMVHGTHQQMVIPETVHKPKRQPTYQRWYHHGASERKEAPKHRNFELFL